MAVCCLQLFPKMIRVVRNVIGSRSYHAVLSYCSGTTAGSISRNELWLAAALFRCPSSTQRSTIGLGDGNHGGKIRTLSTSGFLFDVRNSVFGNNENVNNQLSSDQQQTVIPAVYSSSRPTSSTSSIIASPQSKLTTGANEDVSRHTFLEPGDTGGHIIFASDDGLNPLLTEIRFSRDAVLYNYPYVWFRDHCRCTACVDPVTSRSKVTADDLDPDIEPILDQTTTLGSAVSIRWKDNHFSKYPANWIWAHRFGGKITRDFLDSSRIVKWDAENISTSIRRFDYTSILEDDQSLFDWLLEMKMKGLAVIENVSRETQRVHKLGARVGFLRRCHFGLSLEEKIMYTSSKEEEEESSLETDLPYSSCPPSVHMLHCCSMSAEEHTTGLALQLSDGFHVSEILRDSDPECLEILSKVEWEYFGFGNGESGEFHQRARHPVISLDPQRNVLQVVFNDGHRGPKLNIPADFVSQAYKMLKKFIQLAGSKQNVYEYSLKPGEIITRDNHRVLQRRPVITSKDFEVKVEGAFIEWDEIYSKLRVLFAKRH